MRHSSMSGVRIAGLSSAVPDCTVAVTDDATLFGNSEVQKIIKSTGIKCRHVAPPGICSSDLCLAAAEQLLADLKWERESVDGLIFVTQTPDYILPATACSLHARLRLKTDCAAFDVNLGCSGYTYGIWLAAHLIASRAADRIILLAGETGSRPVNPLDRSARPLFGDAGTATALERNSVAGKMVFRVGTDGQGQNHLIIPAGGFRLPHSSETAISEIGTDGNMRSANNLYMDGSEIFLFTLERIPPLIEATLQDMGWTMQDVDAVVFHQANRFMLAHLAQMMDVASEQLILGLEEFGNTSSASIPLAITTRLAKRVRDQPMRLVLAGFGVGYSWASVALETTPMVASDLVIMDTKAALAALANENDSHLPPAVRRRFLGSP